MEQSNETGAQFLQELPEIEDDVTQLNRILAELGTGAEGGAFVSVFRLDKSGRSGEFLDRYDAAEFSDGSLLDTVRNMWGPGRFQFNVYAPEGGLRTRKVVQIAARRDEVPQQRAQQANDSTMEIVRMMAEQHRATMSGLEMIATALKAQPVQNTEAQMLDRLRVMKELFQVEQPAAKEDTARALLEGVKLARDFAANGGGDEPKWLDRVMDKLALPAMEMMTAGAIRQQQQQKTVAALPHEQPAASPEATVTAATEKINEQEPDNMLAFKLGLKTLLRSAREKDDVAETAERVMLMLPEEDVAQIVKLPNWFEVMTHHEPGCLAHKDWFDKLHAELVRQLEGFES